MGTCQGQGNPDMYGLGIRLGFYFQWFGEIMVEYVDATDVSSIRVLGLLLSGAITVGLIIRTAEGQIQPADMYILLLLAAGTYVFLMPIYIWRVLTCCNPIWDPLRWERDVNPPVYELFNYVLLLTVASVGVWCFATYLPKAGRDCEHYGFFLTKIRLDNAAFMVINVVVYLTIVLICVGILLAKTGYWDGQLGPRRHHRRRRRQRINQEQKALLRLMRGLSNVTVYGLHITAIELSIRWNQLDGVDGVDTSAQTIPLLLSVGTVLRGIFAYYYPGDGSEASSTIATAAALTVAPAHARPPGPAADAESWSDAGLQRDLDGYWLARMEQANREAQAAVRQPAEARTRGATAV